MFAKLSIRTKITSLVIMLLLALSGLGVIGLMQMRSLNTSTVDIGTNWLPSIKELGNMRTSIALYRNALRNHLLTLGAKEKGDEEKRLDAILATLTKQQNVYEKLISSPEERRIFEQWAREWGTYLAEAAKVIALSRQSAGRYPEEAFNYLSQTVAPISQQVDELLQRDIDINDKGSDGSIDSAASTYNSAFYFVITILLITVVIGAGAGLLTVRDVSQGIASIVKPMQDFTRGDLTAEVPHRGEKTEIGTMADALQIFKEALVAKRDADAAAAKEADEKIARGQRIDHATRQFETSIREIVNTVSSASTELEASASTLSTNTDRAQELTTSVAA
ncbi:HAMP domain-containing protein, partial [Rhodopseudomonas faecalis]